MDMISKRSVITYIKVNGIILLTSTACYYSTQITGNVLFDLAKIFFLLIIRNYIFLYVVNKSSENKKRICEEYKVVEHYPHEFDFHLIQAAFIDTIMYYSMVTYFYQTFFTQSYSNTDFIYFIPLSFYYEVVFDFFFYWGHRYMHTNSYLYQTVHKHHHIYSHPIAILTFYQKPTEIIATILTPTILTVLLCPRMTLFEFNIIRSYMMFIEMAGHKGCYSFPIPGFPQFIWLPRFLRINLYTEDHDLHHSHNNCNYSKRFSLWDKAFGTYIPAKHSIE
jgi:hypothetical protein